MGRRFFIMKKLLTFAVSVSLFSLVLVPAKVSADDDGSSLDSLTYIIDDTAQATPSASNLDVDLQTADLVSTDTLLDNTIDEATLVNEAPIPVTEPAAATNYSIVQNITGAALSNEHLTENLAARLSDYYTENVTNGNLDVQQYDEIVNSGLISENAFFANSVFVGDSLTVGFETYCKSKSSSIATDTTYFLARVSGSASACISSSALTKYAGIMPKYKGQVQYVEDSISQMPNVEKMFICYGMNDLTGSTPEKFASDMQTLINRIKDKNPQLSVYVISIPCVMADVNTGYLNNKNIQKANTLLQEMCTANGYGFINIFEHLMGSNNSIRSEYSSDKYVHETNAAYSVWNKVLKDYAFAEITK
jgi:lysophospholipase L1-like esterase